MARAALDIAGERYGRYTVIKRAGTNKAGNSTWLCKCDCGTKKIVASGTLRSKGTVSCGCWIREVTSKRSRTHCESKTRLYKTWITMKTRCYNSKANNYKDYGGRGIKVCPEWKYDYQAFSDWSKANGYSDTLTIDRIDNDGSYAPDNCRWITSFEQQSNKRSNRVLVIDGVANTVTEWGRIYGIDPQAIWARLNRGWSDEDSVKKPSKKRRKRKEETE